MKITSISTQVKQIELKTPFITALRRVDVIEFVRVSVCCDNENIGLGEAPATKAVTGEDIESILSSIEFIKNSLISLTPLQALDALHKFNIGSSAKASLDMAFVSLLEKNKTRTKIKLTTDITISLKEPQEMFLDAKEAVKNGMNILKIKLGHDIKHAIKVTKMLSHLDAKLIIDANQAWSLEQSLKYIDAIKDIQIELIEQPVKSTQLKELKIIAAYSSIPILADESVFTLIDAKKVIESKSADMINIKLMKCGGVTKAREILEYARSKKVKCMLGSMLEGPISINAALHLALQYDDVIEYLDLDSPLLYKEASSELEFEFKGNSISFNLTMSKTQQ
ncbi:dipeptide epimerase [Sulfurimonas sp.]|uniref:dipeptide epimerase n=1 Tax=Sulfurimonas sp. TaxID=2022749 RepID=UPI002B4843E2|nr:dipeptide epimerase [Sulfurimonas sp.]